MPECCWNRWLLIFILLNTLIILIIVSQVKFNFDAIDETDLLEEILKPRVESIGGTLEKVSLNGNHITPCIQVFMWKPFFICLFIYFFMLLLLSFPPVWGLFWFPSKQGLTSWQLVDTDRKQKYRIHTFWHYYPSHITHLYNTLLHTVSPHISSHWYQFHCHESNIISFDMLTCLVAWHKMMAFKQAIFIIYL